MAAQLTMGTGNREITLVNNSFNPYRVLINDNIDWFYTVNGKSTIPAHSFNGTDNFYTIKISQASGHLFWRTKQEYNVEIPEGGKLRLTFPFYWKT